MSLLTGVLAGAVALVLGGSIASLAVDWYRVSGFEGGAAFYVVAIALLAGLGGLVLGIATARLLDTPSFARAASTAIGIVVAVAAVSGGVAWRLADIPPTIGGEPLLVAVELRWPEHAHPVARDSADAGLTLDALSGRTVRLSDEGVLLLDDVRTEDGHWIIPGAARVFTSRGQRLLRPRLGEASLGAILLPLPGHPGGRDRPWTAWRASGFAYEYRVRVLTASEPFRVQRSGPFEVATHAESFARRDDGTMTPSAPEFRVTRDGVPVHGLEHVVRVAEIAGATPALLVATAEQRCELLIAQGDTVGRVPVGPCTAGVSPQLVTGDMALFAASRAAPERDGWLDRRSFITPGLYRVGDAVLDTRTLTAHPLQLPTEPWPANPPGLIDLSPDGRSVVWYADAGEEQHPMLGVTDVIDNRSYTLPIDRNRMRYGDARYLDPSWVAHHFHWAHGADGVDTLVGRSDFAPLAYRGDIALQPAGGYQAWQLYPGSTDLRDSLVALLTTELGGTRLPDESAGFTQIVRLDGHRVEAVVIESPSYVAVTMSDSASDPLFMTQLGARLNSALATGRYDAMLRRR